MHVSFPILIGGGGVTLVDMYAWDYWDDPYYGYQYAYDAYFVFEPGVELEFNLARFSYIIKLRSFINVTICLPAAMVLANRLTDIDLLYNKALHRRREGF